MASEHFARRIFYLMQFCRTQDFRSRHARDSIAKPLPAIWHKHFEETQSTLPRVTLFRWARNLAFV
jgi:hypothetical protein